MVSELSMTVTLLILILVLIFVILGLFLLIVSKKKTSPRQDIPQSVIIYIKSALEKKYDREKIRGTLLDNGWSNDVIEKAFVEVQKMTK